LSASFADVDYALAYFCQVILSAPQGLKYFKWFSPYVTMKTTNTLVTNKHGCGVGGKISDFPKFPTSI